MELHIKTRDRIATVNRRGAARTQHLQHWHNRQEAVMPTLRPDSVKAADRVWILSRHVIV